MIHSPHMLIVVFDYLGFLNVLHSSLCSLWSPGLGYHAAVVVRAEHEDVPITLPLQCKDAIISGNADFFFL